MLSRKRVVLLASCLLGFAAAGWSQISTAALTGVVTDSTGAIIIGVSVDAKAMDTSRIFYDRTDSQGRYTFLTLPVGRYQITVTQPGFKTLERELVLTVNQAANLNLSMEVGNPTEVLDVAAQAPLVNATNSTVSTVIEQRQVFDLPLNGRNFSALIVLTPGVSPTDVSQSGAGPSIQGQRNRDNSYQADGASIARISFGTIVLQPPLDSIQEFRVQSVNGDAEFGQYSGGFVNVVTKSGTDRFHGTAYDYLRNNVLDARNTFQPNIPRYRQNQFGFSFGGPVYIPKLYPRKSKTWFFLSLEDLKLRQNASALGRVPTGTQLSGDFSGLTTVIYNPLSTGAQNARTPFPNNVVPSSLINPIALNFAKSYIPTANYAAPGSVNNFINTAPSFTNAATWMGRIDHTINQSNRVAVRWLQNDNTSGSTAPVGNNLVSGSFASPRNLSVELNSSLSPTTLLTVRYSYDQSNVTGSSPLLEDYYKSSGFNNANGYPLNTPGIYLIPGISITGYTVGVGSNYSPEEVTSQAGTVDLQKIWGRHSLKAGFTLNHIGSFNGGLNPTESFGVAQMQNLLSPTGTGDAFASFLLGLPSGAGRAIGNPLLGMSGAFTGAYLQDTIRVNSRLSINLGLRWDHAGQFTTDGTLGSFDQRGGGWLLT